MSLEVRAPVPNPPRVGRRDALTGLGVQAASIPLAQLVGCSEPTTDEIFASHPDYAAFGAPDTTNTTDSVLGSTDATPYVVEYARQSDGAMLAHETLIVRSSLATSRCSAGGGMGGPPGG